MKYEITEFEVTCRTIIVEADSLDEAENQLYIEVPNIISEDIDVLYRDIKTVKIK